MLPRTALRGGQLVRPALSAGRCLRGGRMYSEAKEEPLPEIIEPFAATQPLRNLPKGSIKQHIFDQYQATPGKYDVELPVWQKALGQNVVRVFNLDMDRIRSGPVAGALFRDLCKAQAMFKEGVPLSPSAAFYYETLGLPRSFQQWYQISVLHVWMLYVRMRALPRKYCREYQQKLVNSLFEDIDYRLREEIKVHSDRTVNSYKKRFNDQLRGSVFAYDEGLVAGDEVLAGALWRNLYASRADVDMTHLEQLVHYIRAQLYILDHMSDLDFATGRFSFLDPAKRYEPISQADDAEIRQFITKNREGAEDQQSIFSNDGW